MSVLSTVLSALESPLAALANKGIEYLAAKIPSTLDPTLKAELVVAAEDGLKELLAFAQSKIK